jgi:Outer membrane lipoprotein carrier protein LolA-like
MRKRRWAPDAGALAAGCALAVTLALTAAGGGATAAPASAVPAEEEAFGQLLQLLAERRHGHVTFTEVHRLALLDRPLESSGELLYDAPDRLEKRTLKPRPEDLLLEHGVLTAQRGSHRHVLALRDYPQLIPYIESIRATLAGDRSALERYFRLQFSGTLDHWTLELVPADAELARTVQHVRIVGERDAIRTVEVRQTDGDTSLLAIGATVTP